MSGEGINPLRIIRRRAPETGPIPVPPADPDHQRVAAVIPAKDEAARIAATVRAVRAIPYVDLVLVVDDGSEDDTQHLARSAGAVVVRHSHNRGKASAMETGAAVVAMRDIEDGPARLLLFVDADLGATAVNAAPLVPPVVTGRADLSIATLPKQSGAGGRGIVTGLARRAIQRATGWAPSQPLSGQRCMTRAAFDAATPLAHGWGVETGMTMDVLMQGFAVVEVPCDLRHRATGNDLAGQLHRAGQYRDVAMAIAARRFRHYKQKVTRDAAEPGPDLDQADTDGTLIDQGDGRTGDSTGDHPAPSGPQTPAPPQEPGRRSRSLRRAVESSRRRRSRPR
ncbi:glycosyltransferase family 2 protein [Ruania alkalisoli]|uniref:Glucosyl-3-phosphoglycerate synthase n=1 Tax=Ruania alkalisoli TaxID=2779775 RepID=A0A7M1SYB0_9MICO|nr:glycosyltransferase family 2 protein [Ruania alkalisoli]